MLHILYFLVYLFVCECVVLVSISSKLSDSKAPLLCFSCINGLQYSFEYQILDVQVAVILVISPVPSVPKSIWHGQNFWIQIPVKKKKKEGEKPLVIGKLRTFHCNPWKNESQLSTCKVYSTLNFRILE